MAKPFTAAHTRIHPRPDFLDEKSLAVVIEMMTGRRFGRRVTGQNMRSFVMEIEAGRVDDHAVGSEIGFAIVDDTDLPAHGLTIVAESEDLERIIRPCTGSNRDSARLQFKQSPRFGFAWPILGHEPDQSVI